MTIFARDALAGRRALVTGASGGLGKHFATTLAAHGAHVIAAARRASALDEVVAAIAATGGSASAVALDVRDTASVEAAIATSGPLDVVVNNAGIALTRPVLETDDAAWHEVIDTNLTGAFRVARAAARAMGEEDRGGVIVNIASILAYRVAKQVAAYVTAKAGLVKLTEALALELASKGIRVNAIAPGEIDTSILSPGTEKIVEQIPMQRLGTTDEVAKIIYVLCTDTSSYVNGAEIHINGGQHV